LHLLAIRNPHPGGPRRRSNYRGIRHRGVQPRSDGPAGGS